MTHYIHQTLDMQNLSFDMLNVKYLFLIWFYSEAHIIHRDDPKFNVIQLTLKLTQNLI